MEACAGGARWSRRLELVARGGGGELVVRWWRLELVVEVIDGGLEAELVVRVDGGELVARGGGGGLSW